MLHTNPPRPAPSSRARNHVRDHRKTSAKQYDESGRRPPPPSAQRHSAGDSRAHTKSAPHNARTAETPPSKASERDSERARRASMAWRRRTPKRASLGRRPRPRRASTSLRSRARASTSRLPAGALFQALPTSKIACDGARVPSRSHPCTPSHTTSRLPAAPCGTPLREILATDRCDTGSTSRKNTGRRRSGSGGALLAQHHTKPPSSRRDKCGRVSGLFRGSIERRAWEGHDAHDAVF